MSLEPVEQLVRRIPELELCRDAIGGAFQAICASFRGGGKLLICGNGGSAADADHWAAELLKGFVSKRPVTQEIREKLPADMADRLQGALPVIPLTGFSAFSSAFANDADPILVYAQLVLAFGRPGDLLIGISTSGDAGNVCAAARVARVCGLGTIALTGESGGKLKALCDVAICVPETETYRVQELHLPVYHCLSRMVETEFFG